MTVLLDVVTERLTDIADPCSVAAGNPMNIVEMGLIKDVALLNGRLEVSMCLTSPTCPMLEHFAKEMRRVLADMPEVVAIDIHGDTGMEWTPERLSADARARRRLHLVSLQSKTT
jgi:metal-sulfur cluster biosynthetic enzyme